MSNSNSSSNTSGGISILGLLGVVFVIQESSGMMSWRWPSDAGLRAGPMQDVSRREQKTWSEGGIDLLIARVEFHSPATEIAGEIHDICTSVGSLHPGIG